LIRFEFIINLRYGRNTPSLAAKEMCSNTDKEMPGQSCEDQALPPRIPSPAAARALAEAAERRRQAQEKRRQTPEIGGRDGPDPVRYGDWEVKGIASDF
jgi:hypothetical protein